MDRPSKRGRSMKRGTESDFSTLVKNTLYRAEVEFPTVLVALAYLDRARPHLQIALEEFANERVFLGALVVASKVRDLSLSLSEAPYADTNPSTPTTAH